jgi:hypothetical protein
MDKLQKEYRDAYFRPKHTEETPRGWKVENGEQSKYPLFRRIKKIPDDVLTEAKVIAFLFEKYGGMSNEEARALIRLEEISDNTYENIHESYRILKKIHQENPAKPLKVRLIAAGFHRMRSFQIAVGMMKEGRKRNQKLRTIGDYDTRVHNEKLWEINAEDSERLSLQEMLEQYGETSFNDYVTQMSGIPNGNDAGEIGRLTSFGGQWLIHSAVLRQTTEKEWTTNRADHVRNRV